MNEGISSEFIIKTGSHMPEVIGHYFSQIEDSEILQVLDVFPRGYFVVSAHREENVDDPQNLLSLIESLNCLAAEYSIPLIVSTHPRTKLRLEALGSIELNPLIRFVKPLGFLDYLKLQMNAFCVLSDSGTITEECGILGFPALNIRNTHERPEGMDAGVLIMSGLNPKEILDGVKIAVDLKAQEKCEAVVHDYHDGNVSNKILNIIISYVPYINRVVWSKP
jgi:UDP-N-acetylglucosamine 2-epimerase (non-hydrolysing)